MAFDASALLRSGRKRKKTNYQAMVSGTSTPTKPPNTTQFGGPSDGRRPPGVGPLPASTLRRGPRKAPASLPGVNATAANRRKKNPLTGYKREQRAALGVTDVRTANAETIKRLRRLGLLPGGGQRAGQLNLYGDKKKKR